MSTYFYHCTINTLDILVLGRLRAADSMGFRNVSLFRESPARPIPESHRYYKAPDNKNALRFGESVYPIKSAFCFESGLKKDVPAMYKVHDGYDENSGLIRKGLAEYLFPADISIDSPYLWGIRVPKDEPGAKECYNRLIAGLFLLNRPNIRIAFGCNDFYNSHTRFYLVRARLAGLGPPFVFNNDNLEVVNTRLEGM